MERLAVLREGGVFLTLNVVLNRWNIDDNEGRLTPGQLRAWAVNRTCYQMVVPRKDAAVLANCPFPKERGKMIRWILDHDVQGTGRTSTGFELWLKFTEGLGLSREQVLMGDILPGVRLACSAYLHFCQTHSWIEGVAASLTKWSNS